MSTKTPEPPSGAEAYLKAAGKAEAADDKAAATKKAPNCPSCGAALEKIGRTSSKSPIVPIYLCHGEKIAFKGDPPLAFTAERTRHPSMYQAITEKHDSTMNIEDVVLGA